MSDSTAQLFHELQMLVLKWSMFVLYELRYQAKQQAKTNSNHPSYEPDSLTQQVHVLHDTAWLSDLPPSHSQWSHHCG